MQRNMRYLIRSYSLCCNNSLIERFFFLTFRYLSLIHSTSFQYLIITNYKKCKFVYIIRNVYFYDIYIKYISSLYQLINENILSKITIFKNLFYLDI